ncbi:MAG: ribosome biogenesis GTPase Der [Candidatus Magnetoovum sp. WYHC-5]|nr:ribosome biogenesis GTPase Der [Candidatus Magnetoovum sp. WYHC-5]
MAKQLVSIVGRQNVGKSTLFNRIVKSRMSIVKDEPGVTRDRIYGEAKWDGKTFSVMDTGGFISGDVDALIGQVRDHALVAIDEASLIIYVMDGRSGLTPADRELAELIRQYNKDVLWVVNKVDVPSNEKLIYDFYSLGEDIIPLSAEHGTNFDTLMDEVVRRLVSVEDNDKDLDLPKIAIVGRPNVGKSTLVNSLLGKERMIVSAISGTTRDTVDSVSVYYGKRYLLIDTAGIRRKPKVEEGVESYAVSRAIRAIERADVALLLIDAEDGIVEQDKKIAHLIHSASKGMIVLVNKWDIIEEHEKAYNAFMASFTRQLWAVANYAQVLTASGLTKKRITKIFPLIDEILAERSKRITTGVLNKIVGSINEILPVYRGRQVKIFYMAQVATEPPAFAVFANYPEGIKDNHLRYIEKTIRQEYPFKGTPVRIYLKSRNKEKVRD